jgi:ubiquinone/menaquinone biosynthesis C-methylase UbiE
MTDEERRLGEATDVMLDQAGVGPGARVLDVAAGAGGQTVAAARRTGPRGVVVATDVVPELVDRLRSTVAAEGVLHVRTAVADAQRLELEPDSFDAAICRLGLMFMRDVRAALTGVRAALRRGGRLSAIVSAETGPEIEQHLRAAGFVDVEVVRIDRLVVAGGRRP